MVKEMRWNQTFGGSEDDEGLYVEQTMDGGYIITGYLSNNENNYNVRLIKTDGQGNEEWNRTFGGGIGYSVKQTTDGGYVVIGDSQSFGSSESDVWLIKTDGQGNEEWNQTFGGSEDDRVVLLKKPQIVGISLLEGQNLLEVVIVIVMCG